MTLLKKIKEKVKIFGKNIKKSIKNCIEKTAEHTKNFINSIIDTIYSYYTKKLEKWQEANRMKEEYDKPRKIDIFSYILYAIPRAVKEFKKERKVADFMRKASETDEFSIEKESNLTEGFRWGPGHPEIE